MSANWALFSAVTETRGLRPVQRNSGSVTGDRLRGTNLLVRCLVPNKPEFPLLLKPGEDEPTPAGRLLQARWELGALPISLRPRSLVWQLSHMSRRLNHYTD